MKLETNQVLPVERKLSLHGDDCDMAKIGHIARMSAHVAVRPTEPQATLNLILNNASAAPTIDA
jgi:hypothetical protein